MAGVIGKNCIDPDSEEHLNHCSLEYACENSFFLTQKLCFIHIEKTFGRSFLQILMSNYNDHLMSYYSTQGIVTGRLDICKVLVGHYGFSTFSQHAKFISNYFLFCSVVRDPLERAFSLHNFWSKCPDFDNGNERIYPWYFNANSLIDTIHNSPAVAATFIGNRQCIAISGEPSFDAALEILDRENYILGCFNYPQEFVETCAKMLHWENTTLPYENVAVDLNYVQRYYNEEGLLEYLKSSNQEDAKLYEYVKSKIVVSTIKPDFDLTQLYPQSTEE